jgi:predicted PurR-regulated permease PerM
MRKRLRKGAQAGLTVPFQKVAQNVNTSQGRYTFYAVVISALIGAILHKPISLIVQKLNSTATPEAAVTLSLFIAFGICVVLLIIVMLKMHTIISAIENRRLAAFNRRLKDRKESDNSDA